MLQQETISFLTKLAKNNNKPWFDKHRDNYAAAKENFETMADSLLTGLAKTEPAFKEQKGKDCVFRIFRDIRFSKDKTPYKPNFGAFFSKGGRKYNGAGYYLHLEPGGKSFAGGGLWLPEAPILKNVRQEIDYNFKDFKKIISEKKFKAFFGSVRGESLTKLPQGYTDDNPAAEYLKMKSFTVMHNLTDDKLTGNGLIKTTGDIFNSMRPFIEFLNKAVDQ